MKKTALTILAPIYLLANPNYENEHFQRALDSYNHKSFYESYELLQQHSTNDSDSKFILARSAYEIGKYDEAEQIYIDILRENPSNSRIKLELAQTYFKQGKYDKAKLLYDEVLVDPSLPQSVKNNITTTLSSLEQKSQKSFFKATLGFGIGYDSNVYNTTDDNYVYFGSIPLSVTDGKSDHFKEYLANVNHTYKLADNLTLDSKLVGFKQKFNNEKAQDLDIIILGTGLSYYQRDYKLSTMFDYNYIKLDGNSYLNNYVFSPSLDYRIDNNLIYALKAKVIKKSFKQSDYKFRDSHYYELANSLRYLSENLGIHTAAVTIGSDNKIGSSHYNVDYGFLSLRYSNLYPLTTSTILSSGIEYHYDRYKDAEPAIYKSKKHDSRISLDAGIIHSFTKELSGGISGRYINNHSNQNLYEYDKYTLKTNIYYSF